MSTAYHLEVFSGDTTVYASQVGKLDQPMRTPWIQARKPDRVVITTPAGDTRSIMLADIMSKSGKNVLTAFTKVDGVPVSVVFSYGTDPSRPSYAGTFSFGATNRPRQRRRTAA